jgi:hypothetical protein
LGSRGGRWTGGFRDQGVAAPASQPLFPAEPDTAELAGRCAIRPITRLDVAGHLLKLKSMTAANRSGQFAGAPPYVPASGDHCAQEDHRISGFRAAPLCGLGEIEASRDYVPNRR